MRLEGKIGARQFSHRPAQPCGRRAGSPQQVPQAWGCDKGVELQTTNAAQDTDLAHGARQADGLAKAEVQARGGGGRDDGGDEGLIHLVQVRALFARARRGCGLLRGLQGAEG